MTFTWKKQALYLKSIYIGKVVALFPFEQESFAAFLQTIPTGEVIGRFPTETEAKNALMKAAEAALTETA